MDVETLEQKIEILSKCEGFDESVCMNVKDYLLPIGSKI
jgi:hypothetical protein